MRRDFPSCFSESSVQVVDSSSSSSISCRASQNLVTCVYSCELRGVTHFITVTWTKNLMGRGLLIGVESQNQNHMFESLCKVDIKPWLFLNRKGSKNAEAGLSAVGIYWDFSDAKFGSSPEPLGGFYLAVALNRELILVIGDLQKLAYDKLKNDAVVTIPKACTTTFLAKREHIFGKKKSYAAKAQLSDKGRVHDISIECDSALETNDPCLVIRLDGLAVMQVEQLQWKFRGNHTISVDGNLIQVMWDVHGWLFGNSVANGVFLFQTKRSEKPLVFDFAELHDSQPSKAQGFSLILCLERLNILN